MGEENDVVLFCDSKCVIHGAKLKVTKDEPQKEWKNSYTWTATIDTASSKIEELFKDRDEGYDRKSQSAREPLSS